ncbi:unnamed protein product [Diatraea saccharalis]|uniref:Peptidase S1 domain-containing protein n=1 Tax=Diatraea saccharalis TaxID=40085 RepID=A0A9N9R583_9NEOP|nr:unnamed protein product [Diatraea saccharalis]
MPDPSMDEQIPMNGGITVSLSLLIQAINGLMSAHVTEASPTACRTKEGHVGECVHSYLCDRYTNTIIVDGTGIIDPRTSRFKSIDNQMANFEYLGGGSLIHERSVLTSAHLFQKNEDYNNLYVAVGEFDQESVNILPRKSIKVRTVYFHHEYNQVFLVKSVTVAAHVNFICLPPKSVEVAPGTRCISSGWGRDGQDVHQYILNKVSLWRVTSAISYLTLPDVRIKPDIATFLTFIRLFPLRKRMRGEYNQAQVIRHIKFFKYLRINTKTQILNNVGCGLSTQVAGQTGWSVLLLGLVTRHTYARLTVGRRQKLPKYLQVRHAGEMAACTRFTCTCQLHGNVAYVSALVIILRSCSIIVSTY